MPLKYRSICDNLFEISFNDSSIAQKKKGSFADALRDTHRFDEVVAGKNTIVLQLGTRSPASEELAAFLENTFSGLQATQKSNQPTLTIPVIYGKEAGPDLALVCEHLKVSEDEFIAAHTSEDHEVDMIGFTPGFAYIHGTKFKMSRLKEPRMRVLAGSIGLAGGLTGIYALEGPGGWPIIGRTLTPLFSASNDNPFLLSAGMRIRFKRVSS